MTVPSYVSIANIQEYWNDVIAPKYFDFSNTNNYRAGLFGYVNEIMSNTTEDTHNAINVARREFYPVTAQRKQSLYKMATIQRINLPMTTPASAKAFLVIPQDEIISKSTFNNGIYTCVIDNTMKLMVDNLPFMLDYPIVIISKKIGGRYVHTSHYDISVSNSLSNSNSKYIMNLVINSNGVKYLSMSVSLRQVELTTVSKIITKDTNIDIVSLDFPFDGNLSNFEIYYLANSGASEIQLPKFLHGSQPILGPYVYYTMIDDNTIRLTFPKNSRFTPAFNSEIRMLIYTSLGKGGNFESFKGDLIAQISSEKYPYNNTMTITGKLNGGSSGGQDKKSDTEFRQDIIKAYSTNNTITSSHDLQLYFNALGSSSKNKILFRKKRNDALYRLFGAYSLLKDTTDNVVPTNTLDLNINVSDFDVYSSETQRGIIKPGTLFEYNADLPDKITYSVKKVTDLLINENLDQYDDNSRFIFTNPFLTTVSLNPNVVGFYLNSIDNSFPIEYEYANDNTYIQFIGSALNMYRNSLKDDNYYKLSINISPSIFNDQTDVFDINKIALKNDPNDENNIIRAVKDGQIISCTYNFNRLMVTAKYHDGTILNFEANNYVDYDSNTGEFIYNTGYNSRFEVGQSFVAHDILATKKDTDLGKLRLMGDIDGILTDDFFYFPFVLENIDSDGIMTYCAYLSTNDVMTLEYELLISQGILNKDATIRNNKYIPINNLTFKINTFYQNDDINYPHKYSDYPYYSGYTMTNTYRVMEPISLIQKIDFIRSTLTFTEGAEPGDYSLNITELPMVKANWVKNSSNLKYLINTIKSNYTNLTLVSYLLENNFGIDFKFFNTYGKSRFYKVGVKSSSQILDSVNCSFSFGISLIPLSAPDIFTEKFRTFVKEYIESINNVNSLGQSIYIMNMISAIKVQFPEINYLEYYGMNSYDQEIQKIEAVHEDNLNVDEIKSYIPEFINIYSYNNGINNIPKIDITLLDSDV